MLKMTLYMIAGCVLFVVPLAIIMGMIPWFQQMPDVLLIAVGGLLGLLGMWGGAEACFRIERNG